MVPIYSIKKAFFERDMDDFIESPKPPSPSSARDGRGWIKMQFESVSHIFLYRYEGDFWFRKGIHLEFLKGAAIMKKLRKGRLNSLRYLCLVSAVTLGLVAIVEYISAGGVANYAGPVGDWTKEIFHPLADADQTARLNASGSGKIEFAAVNYGCDGMDLGLGDAAQYGADHQNDAWLGYGASECMGSGRNINYRSSLTVDSDNSLARHDTLKLFNGNGNRYLMDFCGKNLAVFRFNGAGFAPSMSTEDFRDRSSTAHDRTFLLKASNPPWWLITSRYIHGHGELTGTEGDIPSLNCAGETDTELGTAEVSSDCGPDNPKSGS
jgi:hypothetical protein